jgi:HPt (histidine-containing phosphotransfer) domain-containing protein
MDNSFNKQRSIFDEPDLLHRVLDDEILERNMIAQFLIEIPDLIRILKQDIHDEDAINARRQAHTIRGAAANLSASNLCSAAERIEELCKKEDLDGCMSDIAILETEFNLFAEVIRSLGLLQPNAEKSCQ